MADDLAEGTDSMMAAFRFVPPAGTPIGIADVGWWAGHVLTDDDTQKGFEEEVRERFGVRYCAFISTGRAALTLALLALKALDGGRRDEVVIPSYTCFSVPSSVVKAGLKVRLADVDPTTLDFASGALETLDGSRVLAIVATNLYGLPNDLPAITRLAKARGVFVVDDAAQCLGGSIDGRSSGAWGDVGIYSLDKGKNITSIDGGILVTNSERVAEAIDDQVLTLPKCAWGESLIHSGKLLVYAAMLHPRLYWLPNMLPFLGLGTTAYRTDYPLAQYDQWMAPMGRRLFARLDAINAERIANADRLRKWLPWGPYLEPVVSNQRAIPAYPRFPVLIDPQCRDAVVAGLRANGIGATASYPTAISDVPELREHLRGDEQEAMKGRDVARRIVTLPIHGYVTPQDHERMVKVVTDVLGAMVATEQPGRWGGCPNIP
jgi:dTDP-4-amino-4,6-dideoxygalactose transaminase